MATQPIDHDLFVCKLLRRIYVEMSGNSFEGPRWGALPAIQINHCIIYSWYALIQSQHPRVEIVKRKTAVLRRLLGQGSEMQCLSMKPAAMPAALFEGTATGKSACDAAVDLISKDARNWCCAATTR